jgi:hypothetical protein
LLSRQQIDLQPNQIERMFLDEMPRSGKVRFAVESARVQWLVT